LLTVLFFVSDNFSYGYSLVIIIEMQLNTVSNIINIPIALNNFMIFVYNCF